MQRIILLACLPCLATGCATSGTGHDRGAGDADAALARLQARSMVVTGHDERAVELYAALVVQPLPCKDALHHAVALVRTGRIDEARPLAEGAACIESGGMVPMREAWAAFDADNDARTLAAALLDAARAAPEPAPVSLDPPPGPVEEALRTAGKVAMLIVLVPLWIVLHGPVLLFL